MRQGTACLLAAFEPGTGQRLVEVSARRTGADYCHFLQHLAAARPRAEKIVLVQDNGNTYTHTHTVFYQHLPAAEARALAARPALRQRVPRPVAPARGRLLAKPPRPRL